MSVENVSKYLGIPARTIRDWASSGKLPAYKQGKLWKFNRREIERIAAERGCYAIPR